MLFRFRPNLIRDYFLKTGFLFCTFYKNRKSTMIIQMTRTLIKLMKRKALRKHSLHEKTAASVFLKLFISSNEWCHTTDAP